jgi:hypothetical protein
LSSCGPRQRTTPTPGDSNPPVLSLSAADGGNALGVKNSPCAGDCPYHCVAMLNLGIERLLWQMIYGLDLANYGPSLALDQDVDFLARAL